jgi:hypothetical protein
MPLFRRYGMKHTFGAPVAHRHFDLAKDERLVEYKDTTVPRQATSTNLIPNCWLFEARSIRPCKIKYGKNQTLNERMKKNKSFLSVLHNKFTKWSKVSRSRLVLLKGAV